MLVECTAHLGWNSPLGRGAVLKAKVSLNSQLNPSDQKIIWNPMENSTCVIWRPQQRHQWGLGEKVKITEIKITSSESDECEPVWERRDRRCSHSYMSWDIYAPDLSAWRKSDETSKLHPMSSESRRQHPCGISIYTAAGVWRAALTEQGSQLQSALPCLSFSPSSSGCAAAGPAALWAAKHSPRVCTSTSEAASTAC